MVMPRLFTARNFTDVENVFFFSFVCSFYLTRQDKAFDQRRKVCERMNGCACSCACVCVHGCVWVHLYVCVREREREREREMRREIYSCQTCCQCQYPSSVQTDKSFIVGIASFPTNPSSPRSAASLPDSKKNPK